MKFFGKHFQTAPDGLCMVRAILMQVPHHPHNYTAEMAMRQVALYMLCHPYKYFKCVEQELLRSGESYESYCYNVFNKNIWGDDLIAAVFGDMWNIGISIVTPIHRKPISLWHNKEIPDVMIVANGGCYTTKNGCTHFTATRSTDPKFKMPGSEYLNPTLTQDLTAKMDPIVLADREDARQSALKQYLHTRKERSLDLLRGVCTQIRRLDDRICDMIKESDVFREQKNLLEYQLEKLGVSAVKLKEATKDLEGDRGYVRTEEREKLDKENEKKRKAEEELKEKELKKQKVISVGEGVEESEDVEIVKGGESYEQKLVRQQRDMIKQYETLIQQQQNRLIEQEQLLARHKQEQPQQQQQEWTQQSTTVKQKPSTSGGAGRIDKFLSAKGLTYLPPDVKKELVEMIPGEDVQGSEEDVIITEVTKKTETVKYIPTKVPGIENFVLVQAPKTKSTAKRSSVAGPIPKALQDPTKFYCEKCPCFYTRPDELARHKKKNCLKPDPDHFCDECHKGFFYENTLREHYYHEHTDIVLWHCKKCNEGFHYKSNRSKHRHACPNKNGPDIYPGRADYNEELEETFKAKTAIAVKIPTDIGDQHQEEGENAGQPQPQVSDQAQPQVGVTDQAQLQVGETERAVASVAETGSEILNRLAEGESFGGVIVDDDEEEEEDDKSNVVKQEMEIEMKFD